MLRIHCGEVANGNSIETRKIMIQISAAFLTKETVAVEKLMLLPVYFITVFILSWAIEKYYSTPLNLKIRQSWIRS
jgi:hypothetical protein